MSAATPINSDARDEYDQDILGRLYGDYVPSEHLPHIRDLRRESWDERIGITPPDPVTDAALESDARRLVVHYFQPHAPFIGRQSLLGHTDGEDARPREGEPVDVPVWQRVKSAEVSRATLRAVYESNLRRVLRSVRRLVEEADLDPVVVVGDHGEALGEYGIYGHDARREHPHVRTVPWAVVDDVRSYPDGAGTGREEASVRSRLEDLGYIEYRHPSLVSCVDRSQPLDESPLRSGFRPHDLSGAGPVIGKIEMPPGPPGRGSTNR